MILRNSDIEAARVYHELTKHSYTSVRTGAFFLDWDNRPLPYKIYPEAGAIALPRDLSLSRLPTLAALSAAVAERPDSALDLEALTRVLFSAGGLTRSRRYDGGAYHFRAAPSAGALYPIEIYLAAGEVGGLEAGLYHFSPADLKLSGLRRGDWRGTIARAAAGRASLREARAVVILSAIFWRSTWKYRARGYRYCFWDAGTMLSNLLAAASAEGLAAEVVTAFADPELEHLVGIDGEREGLVCLVALGRGSGATPAAPELAALQLESVPLSEKEVSYPDLVKIHRASRLLTPEEVGSVASASVTIPPSPPVVGIRPEILDPTSGRPLGETLLRRGSTRIFAQEAISQSELATIMAYSSVHPRCDFPRLTETYLIVNSVDGIEPGAWYYSRENRSFELLKAGDFRREAAYLCLEQPLGGDCSALVCYMAGLERALGALGNRGYRDAHLEAGILGGRTYLAAYALERGATGLTFYDYDTTRFFEPHAGGKSSILMVAIGQPARRRS